jgi:hypothetical protein
MENNLFKQTYSIDDKVVIIGETFAYLELKRIRNKSIFGVDENGVERVFIVDDHEFSLYIA